MNFTVYGNCQAHAIARALLAVPAFSEEYDYIPMKPCFASSEADQINFFHENSHNIDLFLTQELKSGWRNKNVYWDFDYIVHKILRPGGTVFRYAESYFRGNNPSIVYPLSFPRNKQFDYLDLLGVLLLQKSKLTSENYKNIIDDQSLFSTDDLNFFYNESVLAIKNREFGIHPIVSNLVESLWQTKNLSFHTFNHPNFYYFGRFAEIVCQLLSLPLYNQKMPDDVLASVILPKYKSLSLFFCDTVSVDNVHIENSTYTLDGYVDLLLSIFEPVRHLLETEISLQMNDPITCRYINAINCKL